MNKNLRIAAETIRTFPASVYSRMFWLAAQMLPAEEQSRYHIVRSYAYSDCVDLAQLERALQRLVDANYNFRSNFLEQDGELCQLIRQRIDVRLERSIAQSHENLQNQLAAFSARPFDLATDPLCGFLWIDSASAGGTLVIKFHHIILSGADLDRTVASIAHFYLDLELDNDQGQSEGADELGAWIAGESAVYLDYQPGLWALRLGGLPEHNSLVAHDRVAGAKRTAPFSQQMKGFDLSQPLYEQVCAFAHGQHCTTFDMFKVIWGIVLSHCTGKKRVLINFPVDVRRRVGRTVKGAMINTLFHLHNNEGPFLQALQTASLHGIDDSLICVPTAVISKECGLDASAFHFTIAQSDLGLQGPDLGPEARASYIPCVGASELLLVCNGPRLVYQHTLGTQVSERFLDDLHRLFETLLSAVLAEPRCDIGALEGFPLRASTLEGERRDRPLSALDQVLETARRSPQALALIHQDHRLSYAALVDAVAACASDLQQFGSTSRNVGVMLPRGIELVVAMLGTWMAGFTFVPLDRTQPPERLGLIAEDANLCVLICDKTAALPSGWSGPCLDTGRAVWSAPKQRAGLAQVPSCRDEPAYLIYTSGSTGTPKGVMQTHRTIDNLIGWQREQLALPTPARIAHLAAIGFDVSVEEIVYALANGSELHVVDDAIKMSPRRLVAFLRDEGIHRTFMPTALLDSLCRAALTEDIATPELANITVAGEALKITHTIAEFFKHNAHISLFNEYGPTETHVVTANIAGATDQLGGLSLIGQPISNTIGYVLGEQMKPVPLGLIGELYMGGDGVALGYRGRQDLTAQRFVPNPFPGETARYPRLYRTGDLVRMTPSGAFEFIGRSDNQVKINGHRVELGEIERVMNAHTAIAESAVILVGERGRRRLVAFYVATGSIEETLLGGQLARQLPDYMLPSKLFRLEALPLNPNGKVDRSTLLSNLNTDAQPTLPPTTGLENVLCQAWSSALGVPEVGLDDDFFDLGGDSLGALMMAEELSGMFGHDFRLTEFYQARTIRNVVQRLQNVGLQTTHSASLVVPLRRRGGKTRLFLFHSGRGGVEVYHQLAPLIGCDVFGVEAHAVYCDDHVKGLDALCQVYAEALMEEIHPNDHVVLGGWSFGGLLAYKVAEHPLLKGRVQGVVLIDTAAVEVFRQFPASDGAGWSARIGIECGKQSAFRQRLLRAAELHEALYRAADPCVGLPDIPILLFSAEGVDAEYAASAAEIALSPGIWQNSHSQLESVRVPSTHFRILEERGHELATSIRAFCERVASS